MITRTHVVTTALAAALMMSAIGACTHKTSPPARAEAAIPAYDPVPAPPPAQLMTRSSNRYEAELRSGNRDEVLQEADGAMRWLRETMVGKDYRH
jgi:hypothetical protein